MASPRQVSGILLTGKEPTKRTLRDLIGTFFPEEWSSVDPESLQVSFQADYTNPHCTVGRPRPTSGIHTEPLKVFIKFHAAGAGIDIFKHLAPSKEQEAEFCREYGLSGKGAKLLGFFQTEDGTMGRIDEFLDARNLEPADVEDATIRADIAKSMAIFHALDTSLPQRPVAAYYEAIIPGLNRYHKSQKLKVLSHEGGVPVDSLLDYDFATRSKIAIDAMETIKAKAGWCIHDVQYMNTMVKNHPLPEESKVALIDFELVMRNYRGFDIGGHFTQKLFKWYDTESKIVNCRPYTKEEKRDFCNHYAKSWNAATRDDDSGEQVFMEAEYGYLLAITFDVHNMLWYMDKTDNRDPLDLKGLNTLFEEFEGQYRKLGLQEPA